MAQTRIHPETGEVLHREIRQQMVRVGPLTRMVDVPGWYPQGEGDGIHSGADLKVSDEAFKELRTAYAARVKTVRKQLRLTQEEAGAIIGGGKRAFQKYESGRMPPSDAAIGLIELLSRHPEEVEMLRSFRSPQPTAAPVIGRGGMAKRSTVSKRNGPAKRRVTA